MPKRGENIYKRKDGRWEGRIHIPNSSKKKSIYGHSYREVKEKLSEYKHMLPPTETKNLAFSKILDGWLKQKQSIVKISTFNKYKNLLEKYILPNLGDLQITEIDSAKVNSMITCLLAREETDDGLSPKTIRDICMIIKSSLKYAAALHSVTVNSLELYIPSSSQKEVRALSISEQKALEKWLLTDLDLRKLGILVCLYTGLRIGEICALKWKNVNLDSETIYICSTIQRVQTFDNNNNKTMILESTPKSQCSIRTIPIPKSLSLLLKQYRINNEEAYILTGLKSKFIEPRLYEYIFEKYIVEAGIPSINFHVLRHTFATRCVELNFDIKSLSEILGHSTTKITLDRYVHPSIERKRVQMDRLSF